MIKAVISAVGLVAALLVCLPAPAYAEGCSVQVGILGANSECQWTYADYQTSASSGDGHTWVVAIQCGNGGICAEHVECVENGEEGFVHDVYMDGTDVGDVCVPMSEVDEVDIAKLAIREFKRIAWPGSDLVVQPPGGKTLVNFATNFYTANVRPTVQNVAIAGQNVDIRATPITYTFQFGDGEATTTASPGHPHPDVDVTHEYLRADPVIVSVDTTYSGEYRIGQGGWVAIPDTLTVAGPGQPLEVVEALPQLVTR